jgi:hypothetical protein
VVRVRATVGLVWPEPGHQPQPGQDP